jgi:hypothetical protein
LVARLTADSVAVRAVVRREPVPAALRHERWKSLADLGDMVSRALEHAIAVDHEGGRGRHERGTIAGTRHVVEACRAQGVAAVHELASVLRMRPRRRHGRARTRRSSRRRGCGHFPAREAARRRQGGCT